jgi:HEAT repeat protein
MKPKPWEKVENVMTPFKFLVSISFLSVIAGCWQGPYSEGKPLDQWTALARDKSPETRRAAAKALGEIGLQTEEVVPVLVGLARDDENRGVQLQAISAIRGMSPHAKSALPALAEIASDVNRDLQVRRAAAKTAKLIQLQP